MEFKYNNIKEINPKLFNGLANLEVINFEWNNIKKIHKNTFHGLINLKMLYLENNQIKKINPKLFNNGKVNLKNINWIDFSDNQIEEIHENTFKGLTNMQTKFKVLKIV